MEPENLKRIKLLVEAGARWDPPPDQLRSHRRAILEHDSSYIVELLRLLFSVPNAVNMDTFLQLCRSQTLTTRITVADARFASELQALRDSRTELFPN